MGEALEELQELENILSDRAREKLENSSSALSRATDEETVEIEERISEIQTEVNETAELVRDIGKDANEFLQTLDRQLYQNFENLLDESENRIKNIAERIEELEGNIGNSIEEVEDGEIRNSIRDLQNRLSDEAEEAEDIGEQASELSKRIGGQLSVAFSTAGSGRVEEIRNRVQNLSGDLGMEAVGEGESLRRDFEDLRDKIEEVSKLTKEIGERASDLSQDIDSDLAQAFANMERGRIMELGDRVKSLSEQISQVSEEIESGNFESGIVELEEKIKRSAEEAQEIGGQAAELSQEIGNQLSGAFENLDDQRIQEIRERTERLSEDAEDISKKLQSERIGNKLEKIEAGIERTAEDARWVGEMANELSDDIDDQMQWALDMILGTGDQGVSELRERVQNLGEEIEEISEIMSGGEIEQGIISLEDRIDSSAGEIRKIGEDTDQLEEELGRRMEEAMDGVDTEELEELRERIQDLNERIDRILDKVEEVSEELTDMWKGKLFDEAF